MLRSYFSDGWVKIQISENQGGSEMLQNSGFHQMCVNGDTTLPEETYMVGQRAYIIGGLNSTYFVRYEQK